MAERLRSQDGTRDTDAILNDDEGTGPAGQQGSAGGNLQRKIGTRDEKKRVDETSAGATRPLGGDQDDSGDKEKM
ncbi:hypothetical protein [Pararhodobacter marinus]|uniref:Uncharacterized protein n=1 Tax=Pararhodobacter marinus TaxID=2184063 RepID=A0A2U2C6D2_9RHOB|nr:hypothetical protein [Pararhodobacter marinus]PWE27409.1 hypothetical protein C4N9_17280 [Pararhodobacter marinus]